MIVDVRAWEALDSRGRPTVAARVDLAGGEFATASVPSGASTGSHEAVELRDGGARFGGRGVRGAVSSVNTVIKDAVTGTPPQQVDEVLRTLDTDPRFSTVGANAVLAVSVAAHRAAATAAGVSLARWLQPDGPLQLPMPMINIVSGGAHAGGAIDIQDVLVIPFAATRFSEAIEWCAAIREATAGLAAVRGLSGARLDADEGGVGVSLPSNRAALDLVTEGIAAAGLVPGDQVGIALDLAATQLFSDGRYVLATERRDLTGTDLVDEVAGWCTDFPILSVEDVLAEDDWVGWVYATEQLGDEIQLVGDDLFVTQADRVERGLRDGAANAVLIKVNQNGLVTGARAVHDQARAAGLATVVSARSGETEDSWLVDLAVGWGAEQIKVGSTHRSDRTAKWNRLLELEATEDTGFVRPWSAGQTASRATVPKTGG
jgi:enolase